MNVVIKKPTFVNAFIAFVFVIGVFVSCLFVSVDNRPTFFFYMIMLGLSMFMAFMADSADNIKTEKIFLFLTIAILGYVFAFRAQTGIDDRVYMNQFNSIGNQDYFSFIFSNNNEKGYLSLVYILYHITGGNYNIAQIVISYLPFFTFGIAINRCKGFCDYSIMVLFIWALYYPIIMGAGLVRIFIAVPIVFVGITFLLEDKFKNFVLCIIFASFFHISALIVLLLCLIKINKKFIYNNWGILIVIISILMPLLLFVLARYIIPLLGSRYFGYLNTSGFSISIGQFDVLPIILLGIICKYKINNIDREKYTIGLILASLSIVFSVSSSVVNIGRTIFYGNLGTLLICASICKNNNYKWYDYLIVFIIVAYGFVYMMYTGYLQAIHQANLFPYRSIWG